MFFFFLGLYSFKRTNTKTPKIQSRKTILLLYVEKKIHFKVWQMIELPNEINFPMIYKLHEADVRRTSKKKTFRPLSFRIVR